MERDSSPAAATAAASSIVEGTPASSIIDESTENASPRNDVLVSATPDKSNVTADPSSTGCRRGGSATNASACKRRRLAAEEEGSSISPLTASAFHGSARKLNYESRHEDSDDDVSDGSDDDEGEELLRMRNGVILRKIQRLKYEDGDQLLHTSGSCKLFEYVKGYDIVAKTASATSPAARTATVKDGNNTGVEGEWKYRGSGCVKFVKCMEEGYNCGMIRAELTKTGTLDTLMCHELIHEEVVPMHSKKGRAYTWRVSDWAYRPAARTLALRFDDDMEALTWKVWVEQSKANNARVRRGLDVPELEDVCASFRHLSTAAPASPPAAGVGGGGK